MFYDSDADPAVTDLFLEIITELQTKRALYEAICTAKLLELIGHLARKEADEKISRDRYGSQISFVIQNMNREFYEDRTLEDYADMCKMSRFHFLRVFKEVTGQSPMEYRNSIRIEHAKRMLEEEDIPISDVGLRVGYASPSYFCDAFKKKVGSSPQKYKQNTKVNK
jgi:AraC-like DNA-binding protein